MSAPRIRVAQCGLGQWGPNLLRNLAQNPGAEVAALCDPDATRLDIFARQHPAARVYTDVAQVAADPAIHAAVLATPAGLHGEHALMLLRAGKDVLVEKPLAMTLRAARSLVEEARRLGRVLMVGHTFLFNESVKRTKHEIESGTLGKLQLILAQRLSLGRIRQDCNALWNLAPHDVSILLHWLGAMPVSVSARGIAFREGHTQEDFALCVLEFPNRVIASIQVSWLNPVKIRQMTIVGTERMLVYDDVDDANPLTLFHQRIEEVSVPAAEGTLERYRLAVRPGESQSLPVPGKEPLSEEIAHFLDCIRTRAMPIGSGVDALRVMSVLEACDWSIKHGGAPRIPDEP